jgi:hypothetical protein
MTKDAAGNDLAFGNQIKCVDPGADLGLELGKSYLVFRLLDAWTIEIAIDHVFDQAVMAGRFLVEPATEDMQAARANLKKARKIPKFVEPETPEWHELALAAGWTPPKAPDA